MSRFVNLELGGQSEEHPGGEQAEAGNEESYYLLQAQSYLENGDFEKALRHYAKVLEFNARNAGAWAGQVRMLIELGQYREAAVWASKALEQFPDEPELLAAKAVALARNGDLQGAIAFSDSSIEERADSPYVWLARGDVLRARKEQLAHYCFQKAVAVAPGVWAVAWMAGRTEFHYRQFVLALNLFQKAVELDARHVAGWVDLGRCQEALGLADAAERSFRQALQLNARCPQASEALARLGNRGMMRSWWRRISK